MSLKAGILTVAIIASGVYGYGWLFELTAHPIDQLRFVMDLGGRVAVAAWVVFADLALREKAAKASRAQEIIRSAAGGFREDGEGFRLVQ